SVARCRGTAYLVGRLSRHASPDYPVWPACGDECEDRGSARRGARASWLDHGLLHHQACVDVSETRILPDWVYEACPAISVAHPDAARARQDQLTKPTGALGRLEGLAIELASLQHTDRPRADRVPIIVFAGDHGIAAQGVSAYPQEVTIAMMANFAAGGAAISVLAHELGSSLEVVDAGTLAEAAIPGIVTDKPRRGSRDFSREAALLPEDLAFALDCGQRAVKRAAASGPDILILGEMGIGNTTSAAAIAAALLDISAQDITGLGTGLDAAGRERKAGII